MCVRIKLPPRQQPKTTNNKQIQKDAPLNVLGGVLGAGVVPRTVVVGLAINLDVVVVGSALSSQGVHGSQGEPDEPVSPPPLSPSPSHFASRPEHSQYLPAADGGLGRLLEVIHVDRGRREVVCDRSGGSIALGVCQHSRPSFHTIQHARTDTRTNRHTTPYGCPRQRPLRPTL